MRDSAQHWCQWICLTVLQMLISRAKVKNMHCAACWKILKSPLIYFFSHISFCIGQLQFLQHQMQQQQMAMGAAAAPQGAAPRQHTASQPRSKRKRSTPQPLSKSWQSEITLNPSPGYTRTWMIHTVLFVCLTVETKRLFFVLSVCLFLADKFVCNGCLKFLENQNVVHHRERVVFRGGSPTPKEPYWYFLRWNRNRWFS